MTIAKQKNRIKSFLQRIIRKENEQTIVSFQQFTADNTIKLETELKKQTDTLRTQHQQIIDSQHHLIDADRYYGRDGSAADLMRLQLISKNQKKKILLCGNYGDINFGDELMLNTLLQYFQKDNVSITVMAVPNRRYDPVFLGGASMIHFPSSLSDLPLIASTFDTIVFGGGTIIEDDFYNDDLFGIPLCRVFVDLCCEGILQHKQVFCVGLSATSNRKFNDEYSNKLQFVIDNADEFSLRDQYSKNCLNNNGIKTGNVRIVNDIAYANQYLSIKHVSDQNNKINIGIILLCYESPESLLNKLIDQINEIYGQDNCTINLIPFYEGNGSDEVFYREFLKKNKYSNVKVYKFSAKVETVCDDIREQDLIISTRYHGCLISMTMGIPTINIMKDNHPHYKNKMSNLLEQFGESPDKCCLESQIITECVSSLKDYVIISKKNESDELTKTAKKEMQILQQKVLG